MKSQTYTSQELKEHLSSLKAKLKSLNSKLKPYQEETDLLKYTKKLVKDLIPELTPEGEKLTPEIRTEKQSLLKKLAAAQKIVDANKANNPNHPKRNKGISR